MHAPLPPPPPVRTRMHVSAFRYRPSLRHPCARALNCTHAHALPRRYTFASADTCPAHVPAFACRRTPPLPTRWLPALRTAGPRWSPSSTAAAWSRCRRTAAGRPRTLWATSSRQVRHPGAEEGLGCVVPGHERLCTSHATLKLRLPAASALIGAHYVTLHAPHITPASASATCIQPRVLMPLNAIFGRAALLLAQCNPLYP